MKTLIELEWRKHNIRTYLIAVLIMAVAMLGFLYLFAYAPLLEPNDQDMAIFSGYANLIPLFGVLNMAVFCVLSAVMHAKFIIEAYTGKRVILLFSYPVSRKKMLLSKLGATGMFTILSMVISNLAIYVIFGVSEQFIPLVRERFTFSILLRAMETTLVMSLVAASTGIVAAAMGFVRKSVPAAIVSAILMASLICNVAVNAVSSKAFMYIVAIAMTAMAAACSMLLMRKVAMMEVE